VSVDRLAALRKNAQERADLLAERDELIVAARNDTVPVTHIAEAVGLSPIHVHRIINAAKAKVSE
jgi:DNA-directed RNA polymerase specialized sigma subunit